MYRICYLLDTQRLQRTKTLEAFLDEERFQKLVQIKNEKVALQSFGAGLLLQLAAGEFRLHDKGRDARFSIISLDAAALCERLAASMEELGRRKLALSYRYNAYGKPYFTNLPLFFSLSHSGDLILCACSEREIGADVQRMTGQVWKKLASRFFSKEENAYLEGIREEALAKEAFLKLWTRKEAYGKLTGEGVLKVMEVPLLEEQGDLCWQQGQFVSANGEKYEYSICERRQEVGDFL